MSKPLRDNVSRSKSPSVLGRALFVGLRTADLFWQHSVLARGIGLSILHALHGRTVEVSNVLDLSRSTGLQPYYQLILALALGSCLKQNYHMLFISEQELSCGSALGISFFNTVFNTLNTILSLWVTTSQSPAVPGLMSMLKSPLLISTGFYVIGLVSELLSEVQRKRFKQAPANRGKPFSGGLFSLARNINYGAYTVWRTAYAFTAGGPVWSLITFAFFFHDFANRGVPVLEDYLLKRYGKKYEEVQRKVPYTLFPVPVNNFQIRAESRSSQPDGNIPDLCLSSCVKESCRVRMLESLLEGTSPDEPLPPLAPPRGFHIDHYDIPCLGLIHGSVSCCLNCKSNFDQCNQLQKLEVRQLQGNERITPPFTSGRPEAAILQIELVQCADEAFEDIIKSSALIPSYDILRWL